MSNGVLAVKLDQLDAQICALHQRIQLSETVDHDQLRRQIETLEAECAREESALSNSMHSSKSSMVSILTRGCDQMARIISQSQSQLIALAQESPDADAAVEAKILLAEYALDFAHRAADRALLLSLNAIDAQMTQQEEGRTK